MTTTYSVRIVWNMNAPATRQNTESVMFDSRLAAVQFINDTIGARHYVASDIGLSHAMGGNINRKNADRSAPPAVVGRWYINTLTSPDKLDTIDAGYAPDIRVQHDDTHDLGTIIRKGQRPGTVIVRFDNNSNLPTVMNVAELSVLAPDDDDEVLLPPAVAPAKRGWTLEYDGYFGFTENDLQTTTGHTLASALRHLADTAVKHDLELLVTSAPVSDWSPSLPADTGGAGRLASRDNTINRIAAQWVIRPDSLSYQVGDTVKTLRDLNDSDLPDGSVVLTSVNKQHRSAPQRVEGDWITPFTNDLAPSDAPFTVLYIPETD